MKYFLTVLMIFKPTRISFIRESPGKKRKHVVLSRVLCACLLTGVASLLFLSCGNNGKGLIKENERIAVINLGRVNAYLVKADDGFILIDTGFPNQWDILENALKKAGCVPQNLKLVILTHGDIDHAGNCARIQEKYHTKIAMHQGDALMVEKGIRSDRKVKTIRGWVIYLLGKLMRSHKAFSLFTPDIFLIDGQSMKRYGLDATIYHLPGHTKGSIALLTAEGDLFIGDTVFNFTKPESAIFVENEKELKSSIEKLKHQNAKIIYPGHGKPFPMTEIMNLSM